MWLITIITVISAALLCFAKGDTRLNSADLAGILGMDHEASEAYAAAYARHAARFSRLAAEGAFSDLPAPMVHGSAYMHAPPYAIHPMRTAPAAEISLLDIVLWPIALIIRFALSLTGYALLNIVLPALVLGFVLGAIWVRIKCISILHIDWKRPFIVLKQYAIDLNQQATRITIELRYNWLTDTVYLQYHQSAKWFSRHTWQLIVLFVAIWLISTPNGTPSDDRSIEVFMPWNELRRYLDDPIPQSVIWPQHPHGIPDVQITTESMRIGDAAARSAVEDVGEVESAAGDGVWCPECWRLCCELPHY